MLTQIEANEFESKSQEKGLVAIELFANWCGHCRMFTPVLKDMAVELVSELKIYQLNVDNAENVTSKYGVDTIPTILWFKDGEHLETAVGNLTKAQFKAKVESFK